MKEGDQISRSELTKKWKEILSFYDEMIDKREFQVRPIRFLVRYIIENGYSKNFFGGTSHFNLIISLTTNNVIDYTRTLKIDYDQLTQTVKFKYWNCPRDNRKKENINWSEECQATEVNDTFEYFLNENKDWKDVVKTTRQQML